MTTRRIVISGCSGGGKSTLLAALATRGWPVREEPGRAIVREEAAGDGAALPWRDPVRFALRCLERAAADHALAEPGRTTLFDRSAVDALSALEALGADPPASLAEAAALRYDDPVFLAPPWRALFATDAERRHDFDAAVAEYERLALRYPADGYAVVTLPMAPVAARVDFVEACLCAEGRA